MKEMDRDDRADDWSAYRKPSVSALVAAASVAFALFVLGGFIKTYRQLEALKIESRRETQELRKAVAALQNAAPPAAGRPAAARAQPDRPLARIPQANAAPIAPTGEEGYFAEAADPSDARPARGPVVTVNSGLSSLLAKDAGRAAPPLSAPAAGFADSPGGGRPGPAHNQVTFVNNGLKKIMIDGGRNQGFAEGGKLELRRGGQWIGDLLVVEVYDNISACDILRCNKLPEPGDSVRRPDSPAS